MVTEQGLLLLSEGVASEVGVLFIVEVGVGCCSEATCWGIILHPRLFAIAKILQLHPNTSCEYANSIVQ